MIKTILFIYFFINSLILIVLFLDTMTHGSTDLKKYKVGLKQVRDFFLVLFFGVFVVGWNIFQSWWSGLTFYNPQEKNEKNTRDNNRRRVYEDNQGNEKETP